MLSLWPSVQDDDIYQKASGRIPELWNRRPQIDHKLHPMLILLLIYKHDEYRFENDKSVPRRKKSGGYTNFIGLNLGIRAEL